MARVNTVVEEFDPDRVRPFPGQPRKRFAGIRELADSITEIGQATPGIVTEVKGDKKFDAQLVDGERRLRACTLAGVKFRAEVRGGSDVEEIFAASFAANFGKQDHDCMEIAEALDRMRKAGKSAEQMARIAGRTSTWVYQHLSLLKLCREVQAVLVPAEGDDSPKLAFQVAILLAPLEEPAQLKLARKITKGEGMSYAAARRLILKKKAAAGDASAYQRGSRGASVTGLESTVEDFSNRVGVFLDMPPADLNKVIDAADARAKRLLAELLRETADNIVGLAEAVEARLPAPARAKAG